MEPECGFELFEMRVEDLRRLRRSGLTVAHEGVVVLYSDTHGAMAYYEPHPDYHAALAEVLKMPKYAGFERASDDDDPGDPLNDMPDVSQVDPMLHWYACEIIRSLHRDGDLSRPVWRDAAIIFDRDGIMVVAMPELPDE